MGFLKIGMRWHNRFGKHLFGIGNDFSQVRFIERRMELKNLKGALGLGIGKGRAKFVIMGVQGSGAQT